MSRLEALACPTCGAPLSMPGEGALSLCIYCNSLVRLPTSVGGAPTGRAGAALEGQASPEDTAHIKQLLLTGRRAEAVERYRQVTRASQAEATKAVEALIKHLSFQTLRRQQLSGFGCVILALSGLAVAAVLAAALAGALAPIWAAVLALFPLSFLLVFAPGLVISLRYLGARTAPATVVNQTHIGVTRARNAELHIFRLLLEVQPPGEQPFRAELTLPVREQSLAHLHPGAMLQVKYPVGNPAGVIFDKRLA